MQTVSDLYRQIYADPLHRKEIKAEIAGVEYGMSNIVSASASGGIFDKPGIGNCAARSLDIEVLPIEDIPRQAEIKIYVRLLLGDLASEWIPKGLFFVSRRQKNKITGSIKFTGYDPMLKAEEIWLTDEYSDLEWPMTPDEAVKDIASRMGVGVDSRNVYDTTFPVEYPVGENGDLTMREVLSAIAVSNAGNWIITDAGDLRLLKFGDIPAETNYLVTSEGSAITFGGVRILV